jgi:hypothetical protein
MSHKLGSSSLKAGEHVTESIRYFEAVCLLRDPKLLPAAVMALADEGFEFIEHPELIDDDFATVYGTITGYLRDCTGYDDRDSSVLAGLLNTIVGRFNGEADSYCFPASPLSHAEPIAAIEFAASSGIDGHHAFLPVTS